MKDKKLNVKIIGNGEPVVFIHSFLWDINMWEPQIKELSKKYKCILIDLWGHGESDLLDSSEEYPLEFLADDVMKTIESLNIDKYNYIGLSVGGMLAPYLLKKHSDKIDKIVIMDSYSGVEGKKEKDKYFMMFDLIEQIQYIPEKLASEIVPMFFSYKTIEKKEPIVEKFRESLLNMKKENINTIVSVGKGIFNRKNELDIYKETDKELLFMVGEDDVPRPYSETLEMHHFAKNSQFEVIPDAGHISNLENPNFVTKKLLEFL